GFARIRSSQQRSMVGWMTIPVESPQVAVFGPDPLLSVTIETCGGEDELHVHPAGQGIWVARMASELGSRPILCCMLGGETGTTLVPLLEQIPIQRRAVWTAGSCGSYVVDHRQGERQLLASSLRPPPHRHAVDELVSATLAAASSSALLVMC